jgi:hypothetical protein
MSCVGQQGQYVDIICEGILQYCEGLMRRMPIQYQHLGFWGPAVKIFLRTIYLLIRLSSNHLVEMTTWFYKGRGFCVKPVKGSSCLAFCYKHGGYRETLCQLSPGLPKTRTFDSHFLKDAHKLFP